MCKIDISFKSLRKKSQQLRQMLGSLLFTKGCIITTKYCYYYTRSLRVKVFNCAISYISATIEPPVYIHFHALKVIFLAVHELNSTSLRNVWKKLLVPNLKLCKIAQPDNINVYAYEHDRSQFSSPILFI